ncbi:alpha/beta hydrolase [Streptomyces sp. ZAF1911]|uniref:alpha/beta fold hydrolase n=1 Tax=Streptomyces sp. ZAF1911 TaxID=2944129 RepID=UPI00237A7DDC|nr:alpha/beta hydrolase [Streptomyces sp. ZAF1911]MDD9381091.1 alpha/beta hydrolase [Streptomyces sp. ZAF1911]
MESVVVDGVRIAYERTGRGRPVVLAGGTGMPPVAWELCGVREDLVRAGFEVITYAARGVAPSDAPAAVCSMADLAGDLAGLMDALGLAGAAVVGYSLGSFTVELLARTRPDLVASAVLMAGAGPVTGVLDAMLDAEAELIAATGRLPAAFTRLQTLLSSLPPAVLRDDEEQTRTWLELLGAQEGLWTSSDGEVGQATAAAAWLRDPHRMAALADITVPVLVLGFEHDLYFPPHASKVAADALPRGEFAVVAGAAHGGLLTHPKETGAALRAFLTRW